MMVEYQNQNQDAVHPTDATIEKKEEIVKEQEESKEEEVEDLTETASEEDEESKETEELVETDSGQIEESKEIATEKDETEVSEAKEETSTPKNSQEEEEEQNQQEKETVKPEQELESEKESKTRAETAAKETKEEKKPKAKPDSAQQEMESMMDEHLSQFQQGQIIEGKVVNVDEKRIMVDIGFKTESAISTKEFTNLESLPKVGERINVYIDSNIGDRSKPKLSKRKADFILNIDKLKKIKEENEAVEGTFRKRVKGGMIVEVMNLDAFLPGSHISNKQIPNLDQLIGKTKKFKILSIDKEKRNIVVSHKKLLIEEQQEKLKELKKKLVKGKELEGIVRNITDYGAFVDVGGIDGLLHVTDMSWGHVEHPSDLLNIGAKIRVKVLNYDEKTHRVSLGMKQLVPHPWENIEEKFPEGTKVKGKVVNITPYGAFVELEPGVEGLVHVSEMSWTKNIQHPKQLLKVGDTVEAIVLNVSKDDRRISLGMKQMKPNPWLTIDSRHPLGSIMEGTIKNITPFGIFVEIEKDIEGLVHISDISWTKRIYDPKKFYKVGQKVEVKILSIDKKLHRISLGIKQLKKDPWENLDEKLPINREVTAKIVKIISKGVLVDVKANGDYVEGFVPLSHLAVPGLKNASDAFKLGEELPLKIIELDLENRRLILSVKAYYFTKGKNEMEDYLKVHLNRIKESKQKKQAKKTAKKFTPKKKKVTEKPEEKLEKKPEQKPKEETKEESKPDEKEQEEIKKEETEQIQEPVAETKETDTKEEIEEKE